MPTTQGLEQIAIHPGTGQLFGLTTEGLAYVYGGNGWVALPKVNTTGGRSAAVRSMSFHPNGTLFALTDSDELQVLGADGKWVPIPGPPVV